jgi:competence ComEA-like helix-hairpin-helix protein
MGLGDRRLLGALLLLALGVVGGIVEHRAPSWLRADPLAHPFGRIDESDTSTIAPEERAERAAPRPVRLDTATSEDLELLPGIGPKTAARILALRDSLGSFDHPEELLAVRGIGPKRLERLRPWLLWDDAPDSAASPAP